MISQISSGVSVKASAKAPAGPAAVAVFVDAKGRVLGEVPQAIRDAARLAIDAGLAGGKSAQVAVMPLSDGRRTRSLYIVGLGKDPSDADALRAAGAALARSAIAHKSAGLVVYAAGASPAAAGEVALGMQLAGFRFDAYRSQAAADDEAAGPTSPVAVTIVGDGPWVGRARLLAEAQNYARTIATHPGNVVHPVALADEARRMAREVGLKCKVMDEKDARRLGMGGLLAVGAGSKSTPPRLIVLEHAGRGGAKADRPLLVVGKAITFDTGGISIKPADRMGRMVFDKCGGMAVLGLMRALATMKHPRRVVGILAAAENHISDTAYRPGDILRMYNGLTVEVTNTDAEGRLVLADALAWGIKTYKPSAVVDLATLTGGVVVALGKNVAGVMANDDRIVADLTAAGARSGEKLWRLPLDDDYMKLIKSDVADMVNSGGREAHAIQGGAFLSHFVPKDLPWAHLDIAGVADTEKELPLYGKGATGWGVRLLVEWASAAG